MEKKCFLLPLFLSFGIYFKIKATATSQPQAVNTIDTASLSHFTAVTLVGRAHHYVLPLTLSATL